MISTEPIERQLKSLWGRPAEGGVRHRYYGKALSTLLKNAIYMGNNQKGLKLSGVLPRARS
jgi:hypothetical protein